MARKPGIARMALEAGKPQKSGEQPNKEMYRVAKVEASKALIQGLGAKDANAVADAFEDLYEICVAANDY
tara:strand:+ start:10107 stop:10316 length:210 start_codon:yes stop_codon:yes gene_type:complete